jgi:RHH-type proline utilization regulon transcriptional repressor/proline dehydrogenase/delta 1-pyrroline-5-carboxylate dehydrogenase
MKARDLDHAIELANGTGYGLTSAIESLDKREQKRWVDGIEAGNLYINRGTTGAIVLRQPFGGMKKSVLGAGIKVGFYNYVTQFMHIEDKDPPPVGAIEKDHYLLWLVQEWESKINREEYQSIRKDLLQTIRAVKSYLYQYEQEFSRQKDYVHIRGQENLVRYLPVGKMLICINPRDSLFETLARIVAAVISKCEPMVSIPSDIVNPVTDFLHSEDGRRFLGQIPVVRQTETELIESMGEVNRFRYAAWDRVPEKILVESSLKGFYISRSPVLMEGRIELLQYFREQSICNTYHRYGNLGERALIEFKKSVIPT